MKDLKVNKSFPEEIVVAVECDDERLDRANRQILSLASSCIEASQEFKLILSSNAALDRLYQQMMVDPDFRGMPWSDIKLWKLNNSGDDELFTAISLHSGVPEDSVCSEPACEWVRNNADILFDCCICDVTDINTLEEDIVSRCNSFVILSEDRDDLLASQGFASGKTIFWFTKTIDLT